MKLNKLLTIDASKYIDKKQLDTLKNSVYRIFFNETGLLIPFDDELADKRIYSIPEIYDDYGIKAYKRNVYNITDGFNYIEYRISINSDATLILDGDIVMGGKDYNICTNISDILNSHAIQKMLDSHIIFRKHNSNNLSVYNINDGSIIDLSKFKIQRYSTQYIDDNYLYFLKESKAKNPIYCKVDLATMEDTLIVLDCDGEAYSETSKTKYNFTVVESSKLHIFDLSGRLLERLPYFRIQVFPQLTSLEEGIMFGQNDKIYLWKGNKKYETDSLTYLQYKEIFKGSDKRGENTFDHLSDSRYAIMSNNDYKIHIYKLDNIEWKQISEV